MRISVGFVLGCLLFLAAAMTAYAENSEVFSEGFDAGGIDEFVAGGLNGQHGWATYTGGGTVNLIEATISTYPKVFSLMKSLEFADSSNTDYVSAQQDFHDMAGKGSVYARLRAEQASGGFGVVLKEGNSGGPQVQFHSDGKFYYYDGTTPTDSGVNYVPGEWYQFQLEFDSEDDQYSFYIYDSSYDLKLHVSNIDYYGELFAINRIVFGTSTADQGIYQVDNVWIGETDGYGNFDTPQVYDQMLLELEENGYHFKDNDEGMVWPEGKIMESLLTMYEATSDTKYIDSFIKHADAVIRTMDIHRTGITDYLGQRNYGWQESFWTYGTAVLQDSNGLRSLEIVPINTIGATNPSWDYSFAIEDGTLPSTFKLIVKDKYMTETYDNLNMTDGNANYAETRINGVSNRIIVHDLTKLGIAAGRPANTTNVNINRQGFIMLDSVALLGWPMVKFSKLVGDVYALSSVPFYNEKKDRYTKYVKELVKLFDNDWHVNGSEGWYTFKKGLPIWVDGADYPINKMAIFGRMLIDLYNVTSDNAYLTKATALATTFKNDLELIDVGGGNYAYGWHYAWTDATYGYLYNGWSSSVSVHTPTFGGYQAEENIGYGGLAVSFADLAYRNNIVFNATDMQRFVNTFRENIYNNGQINFIIYGAGPTFYNAACYDWVILSEYDDSQDPLIYDAIYQVFEKQDHFPSVNKLLGAALLNKFAP